MNNTQRLWASTHDWYLGAYQSGGVWSIVVRDDFLRDSEIEFDNYHDLAEWAGY
jgi:hypothetical protein